MKNLLAFALAIGAIAAGAIFLIFSTQDRAEDAEMHAALRDLQLEVLRQVGIVVHSPDDKVAYDRQQVVRKNMEGVEALRKKYPARLKPDRFIEEMEAKAKAGEKDKAKTAEYRIRYDYAKEIFSNYLKDGAYKPVLTGNSGGIRFDVVSVKRAVEGGQEGLRWDVIIWGSPPKEQLQLSNIEIKNVIHFPDLETTGKRKGQPKRTVVTVNLSPAMPYVLLDKTWEWFPEWPIGVAAGYYQGVPMFDSRTDRANITLTGQVRSLGGSMVPVEIEWKHVKIDGSWKGAPGGQWDDKTIEPLNDEDLKEQGADPAEFDEASAAPDEKK
ncbi:MAG: hypothetical protein A2138_16065 [Deltaproteobacteria bacterium RBG_16_71_12]|nr:MAG: hypothetical protein A2138_16065 [Deltaproteobacteria bacterium RBG_16_71_12]